MAVIDLCSLEDVREHTQHQAGATEQDPAIEALITRLSRAIAGHCRREFAPAADAQTRSLDFDPGCGLVTLPGWDLRAVSAVVIDQGSASEQTLTGEQWRLAYEDPAHGVWGALALASVPSVGPWASRRVTVTGDWGFQAVPEEAAQACVSAVVMYLRGEVQAFGSALQPNSLGDGVNDSEFLPPGIRGLLAHLRRDVYA